MRKFKKYLSFKVVFPFVVFTLALFVFFKKKNALRRYEFGFLKLGTISSFVIYYEGDLNLAGIEKRCSDIIDEQSMIFDSHSKKSLLSKVNECAGAKPVKVNRDFLNVFMLSRKINLDTKGAFDPGVFPLIRLWKLSDFADKDVNIPSDEAIENLLEYSGIKNVEIADDKIRFKNNKVQLDFGGIAKGYIIDKLIEFLRSNKNIKSAIVNIGGDLRVFNKDKKNLRKFRIGMINPLKRDAFIGYVYASNEAVVTSGTYERYKMKEGKRYIHIIDPRNGYPVDNGVLSVTVIGKKASLCDALATAFLVLGPDDSSGVAKKCGVKALFIMEDRGKSIKMLSINNFILEK